MSFVVIFFTATVFGAKIETIPEKVIIKDWLVVKQHAKRYINLLQIKLSAKWS